LIVVCVVVLVGAMLSRSSGSSSSASSANHSGTTVPGQAGKAGAAGANAANGTTTPGANQATTTTPDVVDPTKGVTAGGVPPPVDVTLSNTKNLHDGDAVAIHVTPKQGSTLYGFEAFLCAGNTSFNYDADIRPTETGKCVSAPLSSASDAYLQVPAAPPYTSADASFRVGVGSNSYTTQDGTPVTIKCGSGSPCQIVLKVQYPNGFGFEAYPVTFA
jgi:hypothetical protein